MEAEALLLSGYCIFQYHCIKHVITNTKPPIGRYTISTEAALFLFNTRTSWVFVTLLTCKRRRAVTPRPSGWLLVFANCMSSALVSSTLTCFSPKKTIIPCSIACDFLRISASLLVIIINRSSFKYFACNNCTPSTVSNRFVVFSSSWRGTLASGNKHWQARVHPDWSIHTRISLVGVYSSWGIQCTPAVYHVWWAESQRWR